MVGTELAKKSIAFSDEKQLKEENTIPVKKAKMRRFQCSPVLDTDLTKDEVPLVQAFVLPIVEKRHISALIAALGAQNSDFGHLRRIRDGNQLLLCVDPEGNGRPSPEVLAKIREVLGQCDEGALEASIRSIEVPRLPPRTTIQHQRCNCYWPTVFRRDDELERKLAGTFFSEQEKGKIFELFMRAETIQGTVLFDSKSGRVFEAQRDPNHVLHHSVMVAIERLASDQRRNNVPSKHAIEENVGKTVGEVDANNEQKGWEGQYLGTGFDVFTEVEPCSLCAMALVHCRVRRVFFGRLNPTEGAFCSRWRLHTLKALNHRYEVFRVVEVEENEQEQEAELEEKISN